MTAVHVARVAAADGAAQDAAVDVIRRGFLPREAACVSVDVVGSPQAEREMLDLVRATLLDGVSVAVYLDDVMVGVAVNKIQVRPARGELSFFERFAAERASHPATRWMLDFMASVDALCDLFAQAGGEPLLELMFLGVVPEAGKRGVGLRAAHETVKVAEAIGAKGVSAIWTSDFSRAIGRHLHFQELAVAEHSQFEFEGRTMREALPPHQQRSVLSLRKIN